MGPAPHHGAGQHPPGSSTPHPWGQRCHSLGEGTEGAHSPCCPRQHLPDLAEVALTCSQGQGCLWKTAGKGNCKGPELLELLKARTLQDLAEPLGPGPAGRCGSEGGDARLGKQTWSCPRPLLGISQQAGEGWHAEKSGEPQPRHSRTRLWGQLPYKASCS